MGFKKVIVSGLVIYFTVDSILVSRQVLRAGALGRPRGMGWGGKWERGSGWGTHVNPWLIHVNVWQKTLKYCKVISLQLIKINEKKKVIVSEWRKGKHRLNE